jgi:hypothetical protein
MSFWEDNRWFLAFHGIADAWLWGFDADGWRLRHGDPANGCLAVLPPEGGTPATLEDVLWLADAGAFDHDAPAGVRPAFEGPGSTKDPRAAMAPRQPVSPLVGEAETLYWDDLGAALEPAAQLRFNGSYAIRYGNGDHDPGTDFGVRFQGREDRLALYAMLPARPTS